MKPRNTPNRLASLAAAAVLLLAPALPASAQRRQRPAAQPPRAAAPAAVPRPEARPAQARRPEPDRPVEELLPADGYGVYIELRRLGQLFEIGELKTALNGMRLFDADAAVLGETADFVNQNTELLADARFVLAGLAARPGLPQWVAALQLPTPEAAAGFEPKYRAFLTNSAKALGIAPRAGAPPPRASRGRARRAPRPKPAASNFVIKRAGSWLITSEKQFTPDRLRGEGGASLAENARFQALRNRFSSEQLFVYFDTDRAQQGWTLTMQQEQEARARAQAAAKANAPAPDEADIPTLGPGPTATPSESRVTNEIAVIPPADEQKIEATAGAGLEVQAGGRDPAEELLKDVQPIEMQTAEGVPEMEGDVTITAPVAPPPPSEEQLAARRMERLMRNLWGGVPRLPGAVAAAVGLEGGTLALRMAVENTASGPVNLIPFLPNVISGAPVTTEAAQVAPADGEIFFSASLDWAQIFNAVLGTAKENSGSPELRQARGRGDVLAEAEGDGEGKPASPEESLAEMEKFFGFKIREDFLPTLGGEVAVSLPLDGFVRGFRMNPKAEEEKEAEPGLVAIVALNDADKARRLMPRVLALFGLAPLGAQAEVEKREGFEIRNAGGFAYAFINNFLVAGQLPHVRHAADSAAAHRTLASTNGYRDATAWQARQKLVQAFVSEGLMRHTVEESKKQAGGSTDPVVLALLAQLEVPPEAASLATTNEGDIVLHELRLPLNLIKVFSAGAMIGMKEAPVIGTEMSAAYALRNIRDAEEVFSSKEGRQRFGTLEELLAEDLMEKGYVERLDYKFEVNALGDKFEATATPKNYGKTGRRSFFVDETGVIRAADHKGKPATAQDPPID